MFAALAGVDEGGTGGPGAGMQERARRWRRAEARDILTKSIAEAGGGGRGVIATAHHRDDQAETILLKALRGAHITKMQAGLTLRRSCSFLAFFSCSCHRFRSVVALQCVGTLVPSARRPGSAKFRQVRLGKQRERKSCGYFLKLTLAQFSMRGRSHIYGSDCTSQ